MAGEGLQILTYVRYSWPLSSDVSLTCHTYCDTRHPFIMVISVTLTPIAERLAVELLLPVFTTYICRGWDSNTQPSACEANALAYCATAAVQQNELLSSLYTGIRTNIMILDELVARHRKSERRVRKWRTWASPYRKRQEQNRNCNITES